MSLRLSVCIIKPLPKTAIMKKTAAQFLYTLFLILESEAMNDVYSDH